MAPKTIKFKVHSILKIADMDYRIFSDETLKFIKEHAEVTYKDQHLKEDIYNIGGTLELVEYEEVDASPEIAADLENIQAQLNRVDAGYFRITY